MLNRRKRELTADQFFDEFEGADEKFELIDGEAWMMAGGTRAHGQASSRILVALANRLAGSNCEAVGSDVGLLLDITNVRYPDVAVYCDPRDLGPESADARGLRFPKLIFEVLSPSTRAFDRGGKVAEFKRLDSVDTIVMVDLGIRTLEVHERIAGGGWLQRDLAAGTDLVLRDPALTLTPSDIFGG